jgi:hypothetical protein
MKKSILLFASLCLISITSCEKDDPAPTKPAAPVNPYTEIGLDKTGGKYSGSYLSYQDITNPNALPQKDENYSVDISYVNNSINVTINTSLNIPASLKQFSIQKSDFTFSEINQIGTYSGVSNLTINNQYYTIYNGNQMIMFKKTVGIQLVKNSNSVEGFVNQFYNGNDQGFITLGGSGEFIVYYTVKRQY